MKSKCEITININNEVEPSFKHEVSIEDGLQCTKEMLRTWLVHISVELTNYINKLSE